MNLQQLQQRTEERRLRINAIRHQESVHKDNSAETIALAVAGGSVGLTAAAIWNTVKLAVVVIGGFYLLAHLPFALLAVPAVVLIGGLLIAFASGELG